MTDPKEFKERVDAFSNKDYLDHFEDGFIEGWEVIASAKRVADFARVETLREIVEWLRSDEVKTWDKYENYPSCEFWAQEIHRRFGGK